MQMMNVSTAEAGDESFPSVQSLSHGMETSSLSMSPSTMADSSPAQPRRRLRTREISSVSGLPAMVPQERAKPKEVPDSSGEVSTGSGELSQPVTPSRRADDHQIASPSRGEVHQRSPSATLLSEDANYRASLMYSQDSGATYNDTGPGTMGRKAASATSPPNTWLQRESSHQIDELTHQSSSPSRRNRNRSGSVGSLLGFDKNTSWQDDELAAAKSPRRMSGFKRSLSRKSVQSAPSEGSILGGSTDIMASGDHLSAAKVAASAAGPDIPIPKEKRKLFGRSIERPSPASNGKGGMLRKVSSRTFFGGNKDREQDSNASTDTLASTSSTSTARTEMARKAGDASSRTSALPHWSRRSKARAAPKREAEEASGGMNGDHVLVRPLEGGSAEEYTDLTPRGERDPAADMSFVPTGTEGLASATNGADLQDRGEGLPKRLSGWLSNMLTSSVSTMTLNERDGHHLSASENIPAVRRKGSAISLLRSDNSEQCASSSLPSPQSAQPATNSTQTPGPKPRNAGLLSTLSASGRARAETSSSGHSGGGRSGLDRALRYFLDGGSGGGGDQGSSTQEEGIWLLGVWHGPKEPCLQTAEGGRQFEPGHALGPTIEVSNPSPDPRTSKGSVMEGDASSYIRRESDWDHDDASTEDGSRRTRETSPSIASASTGGSIGRGGKLAGGVERADTPEEQVVARNPPTPLSSPLPPRSAAPPASLSSPLTTNKPASDRQLERTSSSSASHMALFQTDFSSRIWCTYRSHFVPITRDGSISAQAASAAKEAATAQACHAAAAASLKTDDEPINAGNTVTQSGVSKGWLKRANEASASSEALDTSRAAACSPTSPTSGPTSPAPQGGLGVAFGIQASSGVSIGAGLGDKMGIPNLWVRATAAAQSYGLSGRSGLTTDAGWGCMLRTGQSVLANALLNVHLGREWRRAPKPGPLPEGNGEADGVRRWQLRQEEYAKYVRLLSWFMDEPSLACPFGVHRMAREGKRLGKEVGEWFGPSTAAGAIKKLVDEFPLAGLGVSMASDGVVYLNQVKAQSQVAASRSEGGKSRGTVKWDRPVLVLIGIRLGLEGVHPMYHDSIKATFSFPQSVGIAGGRPSSSYYFVGYQANSLFYLDPHHVRPSVPFRHAPPQLDDEEQQTWWTQAYSEAELATYHNDRPRRMPMKSLDPSMLLGFLIKDENSLCDFVSRVKALPRPIFSVLESMPKWMMEDDEGLLHEDDKALESFSESSVDGQSTKDGEGNESARETQLSGEQHQPDGDGDGDRGQGVGDEQQQQQQQQQRRSSCEKQSTAFDRSTRSNMTTTPRSESTFEFIDRQAAPVAVAVGHASPNARHDKAVFLDDYNDDQAGRREEILEGEGNTAEPRMSLKDMPVGGHSFTDSDGGSAWEEVAADSASRRETSSQVEASSAAAAAAFLPTAEQE